MELGDLSSQLGVGLRPRLRRAWKALDRILLLRYWFPHVPLFVAVAIFGILELTPVAGRLLGLSPDDLLVEIRISFARASAHAAGGKQGCCCSSCRSGC